ncbi:4-hydroxy-tetrahydrodipicolinate synthase [Gammaproteobacteria bacterium LSUCC0057]|uniref:4-hydroxy-tetrahydrodipicolinate synthase n=1 Tax=Gammaproteobacteria bacterium LSUCC0057 TaxID=2559237 RepID=A0A4Y8UJU1_9GAMM|nr:4-hydroxy-tetrahydrodipicolinate synthase [Gammaproteobacteria bacterium LSUCC0057]
MITGSIVAMVTPMRSDTLEVDWQALAELVDWHVEQGSAAIVAVGTTGESATLTVAEHARVIGEVVKQAAGRIPVIAGTGANATAEAIELTEAAAAAGADAALLVTPYYNKPTQAGLIAHYTAIARAVALPQILYNVPGRTACDMLPETVVELSAVENIVGVKEATGDLQRAAQLISACPADFAIYSGDDATARELMLAGGHGDISVTANVAPALMAAMCTAALAGDHERALQLDQQLAPLHRDLFLEANPIPVKWAVARLGRCQPALRLPMTPLSTQFHADVERAMRAAGITLR